MKRRFFYIAGLDEHNIYLFVEDMGAAALTQTSGCCVTRYRGKSELDDVQPLFLSEGSAIFAFDALGPDGIDADSGAVRASKLKRSDSCSSVDSLASEDEVIYLQRALCSRETIASIKSKHKPAMKSQVSSSNSLHRASTMDTLSGPAAEEDLGVGSTTGTSRKDPSILTESEDDTLESPRIAPLKLPAPIAGN